LLARYGSDARTTGVVPRDPLLVKLAHSRRQFLANAAIAASRVAS
jgi:hypothetical protein